MVNLNRQGVVNLPRREPIFTPAWGWSIWIGGDWSNGMVYPDKYNSLPGAYALVSNPQKTLPREIPIITDKHEEATNLNLPLKTNISFPLIVIFAMLAVFKPENPMTDNRLLLNVYVGKLKNYCTNTCLVFHY